MRRPVPLYDFTAFGKAIKAARMAKGESRKNVSEDMEILPSYLANIENKGYRRLLHQYADHRRFSGGFPDVRTLCGVLADPLSTLPQNRGRF